MQAYDEELRFEFTAKTEMFMLLVTGPESACVNVYMSYRGRYIT